MVEKIERKWSPQQIAGWLKREHPDEVRARVSHETIYRSLFIQARGVLKKELLSHLRSPRAIRRSRHASLKHKGLGQPLGDCFAFACRSMDQGRGFDP